MVIPILKSLLFPLRGVVRTLGIAAWPLNRLRTRLSIPLGFLHDGSTPVQLSESRSSVVRCVSLTFEAVRLVAVEALGVYRVRQSGSLLCRGGRSGIRFLTIGTCFLAATICTAACQQRRARQQSGIRTLSSRCGKSRLKNVKQFGRTSQQKRGRVCASKRAKTPPINARIPAPPELQHQQDHHHNELVFSCPFLDDATSRKLSHCAKGSGLLRIWSIWTSLHSRSTAISVM